MPPKSAFRLKQPPQKKSFWRCLHIFLKYQWILPNSRPFIERGVPMSGYYRRLGTCLYHLLLFLISNHPTCDDHMVWLTGEEEYVKLVCAKAWQLDGRRCTHFCLIPDKEAIQKQAETVGEHSNSPGLSGGLQKWVMFSFQLQAAMVCNIFT